METARFDRNHVVLKAASQMLAALTDFVSAELVNPAEGHRTSNFTIP
jgi:hypothetical protein